MDFETLHREHHVKVEIDERVAVVTMDRPQAKNAVNYAMHRGLEIVFHELSHRDDVGAIVLKGANDTFSAGGDIKNYGGTGKPIDTLRGRDLNWAIARCEAPVLCALQGAARGVAASVALTCDIVYMADDATIGDVHTLYGIPAGDGGQVMWPLLVGPNIAKEILMRGTAIDAAEAERIRLVNRVFPAATLLEETLKVAREIASRPPAGVRWTKLAVNKMVIDQINLTIDFGLAAEALGAVGATSLDDMKRRQG